MNFRIKAVIFLIFISLGNLAFSQNKKLDNLEQLYAQEHYKLVYKKANKLMDTPDYDFSDIPKYYKSLSLIQMAKNEMWFKRNKSALTDAEKLFKEVRQAKGADKILAAHLHELSDLKEDLLIWSEDLKNSDNKETGDQVDKILVSIFSHIPSKSQSKSDPVIRNKPLGDDERSKIIAFAEKAVGTPYVWGGTSTKGFDCSGFTSYVMKEFGKDLPRRAVDQYNSSNKIKQKSVQKGDLVFFNNGSGISHVGIIVSDPGEPLTMIHASSSKGVIVTNLETSEYWMKRLESFGTYLN